MLYLVKNNPPTSADFLSASQRGTFVGKPECLRASLSCGLTRSYIRQLQANIPNLRSMHVAESVLHSEHGKIQQTGKPGHYSMWLRRVALAKAPTLFRVVE